MSTPSTKSKRSTGLITRDSASDVEIVTAAEVTKADLRAAAERINKTIDLIKGHQDAFEDATLEHRLCIGLEIAIAQQAFGMTRAQAGAIGGSMSRRDTDPEKPAVLTSNPLGFSNWLKKETPDLKRSTAQKYATAFNALGIPAADATPKLISEKLKKFRHDAGKANLPMPSLAMLYKQGKPPKPEAITVLLPKTSKQVKLEDAREFFALWKENFDKGLAAGHLDHLDKKGLLDLQEFTATVRDRIKARLK